MNKLIIFLCMLFFTSCLKKIEGRSDFSIFSDKPEELKELENKCSLINKEGNIQDLSKELNSDVRLFQSLTDEDEILQNKDKIEKLATKIGELVQSIEKIISPEFTAKKYSQKIDWSIDYGIIKGEIERIASQRQLESAKWKLKNYSVIKAYKNGTEDERSRSNVFIAPSNSQFNVFYLWNNSALGICQLQETFLFVIEVAYAASDSFSVAKQIDDDAGVIKLKFGLFAKNPTDFSMSKFNVVELQ